MKLTHERRVQLLAFLTGLPGAAVALGLLWFGEDYPTRVRWTLTVLVLAAWWLLAAALRRRVVFPLQTLANLLEALREGDYSLRGRRSEASDPLGQVMLEVNALAEILHRQRLGAIEASALLAKVMEEIDVAIFAFDDGGRLRLVNRAGERLLARPAERLLDRGAAELGLKECLEGPAARTLEKTFPGGSGRWGLKRGGFRQEGARHHLLVLSDLSRALRQEERQAWRRLIRVLGHEINNSLAPIKSMAATLRSLLGRDPRPADWEEDLGRGLDLIDSRSEALARFIGAYARLARLPAPRLAPVEVAAWVRRAAALETRLPVAITPGPDVTLRADGDQLDQLLINLLRNAVDAALETGGAVRLTWALNGGFLEVRVEDEGPGLARTDNLFVPFFTTKPGGTGIGLALSQQIAEAHGGTVTLRNRPTPPGAEARLRLPV